MPENAVSRILEKNSQNRISKLRTLIRLRRSAQPNLIRVCLKWLNTMPIKCTFKIGFELVIYSFFSKIVN